MKILITAFDPFGGEKKNPALEAIKLLPEQIKNHQITKLEIPTVFHKSSDKIADKLKAEHFDAVIAIGQAGGRYNLTPERVGINIDDARIPDNENNQPIDIPIQQDGAPAYFSNLPVKKMTQAIKDAGIPAALSNTAGTFVCNHILYQLGYLQATRYPDIKFGFIHVPFIPEQVVDKPDKPSMALSSIVTGLEAAIGAISEDNQDIKEALGEIQ
ncbi:pyroglutamyl-peptidase I [Staphylococcus carnosus]|uniref:Pyrrolidone-carboxylate peptidase n=2 Tax=Staphylococcus carnosus TaxID=1281 RepID=PCP_STACT|nr:pyroglutamyl-peptidase I [Staphylococcus carnosus]B9DND6.1 RecName: Full=Pyrrolidone-carboxylate peptidase; AltName: Full=5-oxoprolyl-peptidase; AltName: Full=Pyroglutamyl-peptidase I; Short=PGP-I; Short=Pyrase [Staphylococcus carnosus subsp. carnosus TM300]KKB26086.1 pyrrolidone-carboxylate peptidase [Staphylococcus carnosus]KOR13468.1 pyrrolidone-carboxylate peptidase [Staphylococcus carnosus]POA06099.1 pyroglutamyl-peptidase I [Staphylococcus carnosus]QPT04299.1 pyroglutamyl-peptidase I 